MNLFFIQRREIITGMWREAILWKCISSMKHCIQNWQKVIDVVAERIRSIGHYSQGRLKDFIELTNLLEPDYTTDQKSQLQNLLEDHETISRYLRKDIPVFNDEYHDIGNADLLTDLLKSHEKWAWFIRSYLS